MTECDFRTAEPCFNNEMHRRRETDLRLSIYRAIYAGDIESAEDAMNLMAMVDIDRDIIWQARGMERG